MTKNYIKKAIENGTVEFISVSEQTQYTIIKGSFGWRADGINIHSGTDNGFYFEETLNLLASRLSEIDDLEIADDNEKEESDDFDDDLKDFFLDILEDWIMIHLFRKKKDPFFRSSQKRDWRDQNLVKSVWRDKASLMEN